MRRSLVFAAGLAAVCLPAAGRADDWPQFRGPGSAGVSAEKQLPQGWAKDKNVQWTAKVAGRGWSSPIVWGDKVFLTAAFSAQEPEFRPGGFGPPGGGGRPGGGGFPGRPGGGPPGGGGMGRGGQPPDRVYKFDIVCLDRNTGKVLWKETALEGKPKIATHGSNTYASETPENDGGRV